MGVLTLGVLLTFFSASDSKRWGIRIGLGFWGIYGLTGLIGDLLSYARLFGLGIATTAIAEVMNQLAGRYMMLQALLQEEFWLSSAGSWAMHSI